MSAYNIWLCALNLYILFGWSFSGFHPFQSLGRCHIQVSFVKILLLFFGNTFRSEITWTVSFSVLHDCTVNSLGSCQTIFCFINITMCIDLSGPNTLSNSSCRSNRVLTSQCNETHLKGCHLRTGKKSHCISCTCVKRRIPHLMSGKPRIIRSVKSRCTTCGTKNCFRINVIENILINAKSNCACDFFVFCFIICNIYMIENRNILLFSCRLCKDWLHIFAIDLDVSVSSGNIFSVFVLQDDQPQIFHHLCHMIQSL